MYALFPIRSTCYVLCRLNSNSRMYFALKVHEVSPCPCPCPCPCPYPCLEGQVLVLGGSVLVNITEHYVSDFNLLLVNAALATACTTLPTATQHQGRFSTCGGLRPRKLCFDRTVNYCTAWLSALFNSVYSRQYAPALHGIPQQLLYKCKVRADHHFNDHA